MVEPAPAHVVFGAGQVGRPLARLLAARGLRVRLVSRSGTPAGAGVEAVAADALDAAGAARAAEGAAVVYHCVNTTYAAAAWADVLPRVQASLVAAAGRAGARLVVLDNLYALGRTHGRPMSEDTPANPCSRKGEVRARLAEALLAAHARGDVRAVLGRASDFFGPGAEQSHFSGRFFGPVLRGGKGPLAMDPATPHSYHYLPDVAAGLAALGEAPEDTLGRAWMLPCEPAVTTRALVDLFGAALGRPVAVRRMPRAAVKVLGLVVPVLRELDEVLYQWEEPFVVDDARFRRRLGATTVPLARAAAETVAWARGAFTPARAA